MIAHRGMLETQRDLLRRSRSVFETELVKGSGIGMKRARTHARTQTLFTSSRIRLQLALKN